MSVRSVRIGGANKANTTVVRKKALDDLQQQIVVVHEPEKNVTPEVDIVLVPGLGANPEACWTSTKSSFNWILKDQGLKTDFPKARILLYKYESAWTGVYKVKQWLDNLAYTLLLSLRIRRDPEPDFRKRPIIFIGHSMGGLVIAKAVTMADTRRDRFATMFESITGCIFFGTPFDGAAVATPAGALAALGQPFDVTSQSKLLDVMTPGDESLRELKQEFLRVSANMASKIELYCFWEQHPTNFADNAKWPSALGHLLPKKISEFVSRTSATLPGYGNLGLESNHRDLVKFDSPKDSKYQKVREEIKPIIARAQLLVKNRLNATRGINRETIKDVLDALEGAEIKKQRKTLRSKHAASSWLIQDDAYRNWIAPQSTSRDQPSTKQSMCLWIRGQLGRGKTSNMIAALDDIDSRIKAEEEKGSDSVPPLLVYFFCDDLSDYCTAEDVLKSFLRQLVDQNELLAPYAKHFARSKKKEEKSRPPPPLTVENMWQSLQDMLWGGDIESRVYFVINNLHVLPENSSATATLMKLLNIEFTNTLVDDPKRASVRWFITSRDASNVHAALRTSSITLMDLEDEKYEDQVQLELKKHAYNRVSYLRTLKEYNRDTAYFAHSLIGKRAPNMQWIDIAYVQLAELSKGEKSLKIRQILETMPKDLTLLLERAWKEVFAANAKDVDQIKEMLRALVLAYEDPTEPELLVLTGLSANEQDKAELHDLVSRCRPLLVLNATADKSTFKIGFMNIVVKTHLLQHGENLIGLSEDEVKWQHGVLALRSFSHIMDALDFPEPEIPEKEPDAAEPDAANEQDNDNTGNAPEANQVNGVNEPEVDADNEEDDEDEDPEEDDDDEGDNDDDEGAYTVDEEEPEEKDEEADRIMDIALPYMVKYWIQHASHATRDIAEDLADEQEFWKDGSLIRRRWLIEYARLANVIAEFKEYPVRNMLALHTAASVGFGQLVAALVKNGYEPQLRIKDEWSNSPLHLAAYFSKADNIDEILRHNINIDDGAEDGDATPLGMAAMRADINIMKKLIARGADVNIIAELSVEGDRAPVISAAIESGNVEAVAVLIENGAHLSLEDNSILPPLAIATGDLTMFNYLIERYKDALTPDEYSAALIEAAYWGRMEVFEKLLDYKHDHETYQKVLEMASNESNWNIVQATLGHCGGLNCDEIFVLAATTTDDQDEILEEIWRHTEGMLSAEVRARALYQATDCEKESTVKVLLEKYHADPNAVGEDYGNALTAAANDGTIDIVRMLVDKGAEINSPNGWALQAASREGHMDVVQYLLDNGAQVNAITTNENFPDGTALQAACESGNSEIIKLLLDHKANPDIGPPGSYPLIAAAAGGVANNVEMLIHAGANVNVVGGAENSSPLIHAVMYLPVDTIRLLLDSGADIDFYDPDHYTALLVAAYNDYDDCVQFLLERGADVMCTNAEGLNSLQVAVKEKNDESTEILSNRIAQYLAVLNTALKSGDTNVHALVKQVPAVQPRAIKKEEEDAEAENVDKDEKEAAVDDNDDVIEEAMEAFEELTHENINGDAVKEPEAENLRETTSKVSNARLSSEHDDNSKIPEETTRPESADDSQSQPSAIINQEPPDTPEAQPNQGRYGRNDGNPPQSGGFMIYSYEPDQPVVRATSGIYGEAHQRQETNTSNTSLTQQASNEAVDQNQGGRTSSIGSQQPIKRKPAPGRPSQGEQTSNQIDFSTYQAYHNMEPNPASDITNEPRYGQVQSESPSQDQQGSTPGVPNESGYMGGQGPMPEQRRQSSYGSYGPNMTQYQSYPPQAPQQSPYTEYGNQYRPPGGPPTQYNQQSYESGNPQRLPSISNSSIAQPPPQQYGYNTGQNYQSPSSGDYTIRPQEIEQQQNAIESQSGRTSSSRFNIPSSLNKIKMSQFGNRTSSWLGGKKD